jgi:beta-lactam-binding protein with PASTA domain
MKSHSSFRSCLVRVLYATLAFAALTGTSVRAEAQVPTATRNAGAQRPMPSGTGKVEAQQQIPNVIGQASVRGRMPSVTGKSVEEAVLTLRPFDVGIRVDTLQGGGRPLIVTDQRPGADSSLAGVKTVLLTAGPATPVQVADSLVTVPDLTGLTTEEARSTLMDSGLVVAPSAPDDTRLTVGSQSPAAGDRVPVGTAITLILHATVPKVRGLTLADAREALREARLVPVLEPGLPDSARWTVDQQQPDSGASVPADGLVQLTLVSSRESAPVIVPSVTGRSISDARASIEGVGLLTGGVDRRADRPWWSIRSQTPLAGESAVLGSTVRLEVGFSTPALLTIALLAVVLIAAVGAHLGGETPSPWKKLFPPSHPVLRWMPGDAPRIETAGAFGHGRVSVRIARSGDPGTVAPPGRVFVGPHVRVRILPGVPAVASIVPPRFIVRIRPAGPGDDAEAPGRPANTRR